MMFRRHSRSGFTLIELAIVLAVVGLMSVGLWRLLSSSNQQLKDTATASQQAQLISAMKAFLATGDGQNFMTNNAVQCASTGGVCQAGQKLSIALPHAANAAGSAGCSTDTFLTGNDGMTASQATTFCSTLPIGYSSATTNAYGQGYQIFVLRDSTPAPNPPATYSFLVGAFNGDTISDTSGGRISSQIGGDGGFMYNTAVCGTANQIACGAYGAWSQDITAYGLSASNSLLGHPMSRTYVAADSNTGPWLARLQISGYNTLTGANIYLHGNQINSGNLAFGIDQSVIALSNTGVSAGIATPSPLQITTAGTVSGVGSNPAINIITGCHRANPNDNTCGWGLQVSGDVTVPNGMVNAGVVFTSSDVRLKRDIHPLTAALDSIMQLKPVAFTYKSNGVQSFGVTAQDLNKIYPQLVSQGDEAAMKSVNYEGLIGPLIGAVQELKHENDDLRQRLQAEEAREKRLEQKIGN